MAKKEALKNQIKEALKVQIKTNYKQHKSVFKIFRKFKISDCLKPSKI